MESVVKAEEEYIYGVDSWDDDECVDSEEWRNDVQGVLTSMSGEGLCKMYADLERECELVSGFDANLQVADQDKMFKIVKFENGMDSGKGDTFLFLVPSIAEKSSR